MSPPPSTSAPPPGAAPPRRTPISGIQASRGRIFIVDDHPVFRFGLTALLRAQGLHPVGEAPDSRSALVGLAEVEADLVIMDISLGDGSGLGLIRELKTRWPALPVLALSIHDELLFAERALHAGAIGYLGKSVEADYLVDAIQRALRGELVVTAAITDLLLRRVTQRGSVEGAPASPVALLSDRELEILELMGNGRGTREVAEVLHISVKTVESHQGHIKSKLGVRNASELMRVAVSWVGTLAGAD